jgi:hypothetical protein
LVRKLRRKSYNVAYRAQPVVIILRFFGQI